MSDGGVEEGYSRIFGRGNWCVVGVDAAVMVVVDEVGCMLL